MRTLYSNPGKKDKRLLLRKQLLKNIFEDAPLPVKELFKKNDSSLPTVTSALNELIKEGLVLPFGAITETGGRNAALYRISPGGAFSVGIWVENKHMTISSYKLDLTPAHPMVIKELKSSDEIPEILEEYFLDKPHLRTMLMGVGIAVSPGSIAKNSFPTAEVESLIKSLNKNATVIVNNWISALSTQLFYNSRNSKPHKALLAIRAAKKNALSFIIDNKKIEGISNKTGVLNKEQSDADNFDNLLKCIIPVFGFNEIVVFKHSPDSSVNFVSTINDLIDDVEINVIDEDAELRTKGAAMLILEDRFLKYD